MKSKTQILQKVIQRQRLISMLLIVFMLGFAVLAIVLYKNNLSIAANSSQPPTFVQSLRNFAVISTVSRTYTSKGTVIMNNLWRPTDQIAAGYNHTCAIANGQVYCWGQNNYGQLGDGTTTNSSVPVAVDTSGVLSGKIASQITTGYAHSCALAGGKVYCWGYNAQGNLGNNKTINSNVPVAVNTSGVLSGKTVTQVVSGMYHTCALANSQAYCWGQNTYGRLGDNSTTNSSVPVAVNTSGVLSGKTVSQITAGYYHTCAIANGQAYCWGSNQSQAGEQYGQLGNGSPTNSSVPVAVKADVAGDALYGKAVTQIASGTYHTCVLANGQIYCWGYNYQGQLGNNSNADSGVPVAVNIDGILGGKVVTQVAGGGFHTCTIANGQPYCWGNGGYGQLGNNTTNGSTIPVAVDTSGVLSGRTITQFSAGYFHTCATANGQIFCWGRNNYGQLGNSSTIDTEMPGIRVGMY